MIRITTMLAVLLVAAVPVMAESLAVTNPSFETPMLDPGGYGYDLGGWSGPPPADQSAFLEHIVDFSADGTNHLGMATGIEVYQDLGVPVLPETTYTLNVAVGNRDNGWNPAGSEARYGLYAGGPGAGRRNSAGRCVL